MLCYSYIICIVVSLSFSMLNRLLWAVSQYKTALHAVLWHRHQACPAAPSTLFPRIGVHIPNRSPSSLTSSASGVSVLQLQNLGGQVSSCGEGKQSPKQTVADAEARGGLEHQILTLSSKIQSLGLVLKLLVEQQRRLERE